MSNTERVIPALKTDFLVNLAQYCEGQDKTSSKIVLIQCGIFLAQSSRPNQIYPWEINRMQIL